jgi:hypothetical protein|tara:strand:+ start:1048 stop:1236 length:189 start_codon:yes stop_codon:yes gene_type:complete
MKQIPISSLSEIFCLKSKDKVLIAVNLLIRFFCKSADLTLTENEHMKKMLSRKNDFFAKINL